jgi:uncharacterized protein (TIGR02246 family)
MRSIRLITAIVILGASWAVARGAEQPKDDAAAVRAAVNSYMTDYNRGDAKVVAQHWSDAGEWISPAGQRLKGPAAIQKGLEAMFAESKGVQIEVLDSTVHFVTPEVSTLEGAVQISQPGQAPRKSSFMVVMVKKDGAWKLDSARETEMPEVEEEAMPLDQLDWLIGDWIDQSEDASIDTTVSWTKNKSFIKYAFKATVPDEDDLDGTQIIGWDPAAGTIRSWMFDSDGGFGGGTWTQKGDQWIVKFTQVLPDGGQGSATNIYTLVDENTFTWQSIDRKVDGQYLPNVEAVKMVRKPAAEPAKTAEPVKAAEPSKAVEPAKAVETPSKKPAEL